MKMSRGTALTSLSLAVLLSAGVLLINLRAAQQDADDATAVSTSAVTSTATSAVEPAAAKDTTESQPSPAASAAATPPLDPQFAVPDGSVAQKLEFLDKLTQPTTDFTSAEQANKYWGQAAVVLKSGAEQVLAAKPTDAEASQAVQFKAEALRILAMLGDKNADTQRTEFLDACLKDPRRDVSTVVAPLRMLPKMRRWMQLDAATRTAAADRFLADVKAAGPTPQQAEVLIGFADSLSDSPNPLDTQLAARAVDGLLPTFQKSLTGSGDPRAIHMLAMLEGLSRRLHLPGSKLELEGALLNGQPLDWEAYRGKVVLIDFWASWCPECLKEVPNILDAYHEYHDKGFDVIGVCLDDERRAAEETIRQTGMIWPQLFHQSPPGSNEANPLARKYAITGIPRAILVDQQGNVVSMLARGPMLDAYLQKLLGPANHGATSSSTTSAAPHSTEASSR